MNLPGQRNSLEQLCIKPRIRTLWDKMEDKLQIEFIGKLIEKPTKRKILSNLALVFDPLGIVSPVFLKGKIIFRMICELGLSWDQELPKDIERWGNWEQNLPDKVEIP